MNRNLYVAVFVLVGGFFVFSTRSVLAQFVGPTAAPPLENVPGVIWNRPAFDPTLAQPNTEFNIGGDGRVGEDLYLTHAKALRIDAFGDSWLNVGNWQNGKFTLNVIGDIRTDISDGAEGKISAPKFCLGNSCITAWPGSGSGGSSIDSVVAGTGLTGGGSSGAVTVSFDESFGNGKYVNVTGDTMTGPLILNANPSTPLGAATKQYVDNSIASAGGGDITGVTPGTGLQGGGQLGDVTLSLSQTYQTGQAFDDRFVNVAGDAMTGGLTLPEIKLGTDNGYVVRSDTYQAENFNNKALLDLKNPAGARLKLVSKGSVDSLIDVNGPASVLPSNPVLNLAQTEADNSGMSLSGLRKNEYSLSWRDSSQGLGASQHTSGWLGRLNNNLGSEGFSHYGVESEAYTQFSVAGKFRNFYNGSNSAAYLGTPTKAADFIGNVCINGVCRNSWPSDAAGVTQVSSGAGLTGGPITNSGMLALDTDYTDTRYINADGDTMNGNFIVTGTIDAGGTITANGNGGKDDKGITYGFYTNNPLNDVGLSANAGSIGVRGDGALAGGYFLNPSAGNTVHIAHANYGIYAAMPSVSDYGVYSTGRIQAYGDLGTDADLDASDNVPSSCVTETVGAGPVTYQCSEGKFMSGVRKNAANVVDGIVCCEL